MPFLTECAIIKMALSGVEICPGSAAVIARMLCQVAEHKEHRGKILSQFFKKLNGQIIILSTDEEIVGEYRESISDIISNTFVLNHTANGNTEILANTYFGGKHND